VKYKNEIFFLNFRKKPFLPNESDRHIQHFQPARWQSNTTFFSSSLMLQPNKLDTLAYFVAAVSDDEKKFYGIDTCSS